MAQQDKFEQLVTTVIHELQHQHRKQELNIWIGIAESLNCITDLHIKTIVEEKGLSKEIENATLRVESIPEYSWNKAAAEAEAAAAAAAAAAAEAEAAPSEGGRHTKRNRTSRRLKRSTKNNRKSRR